MTGHISSVFKFGDVEVWEGEYALTRAGETVMVEPTAFRVLIHLLRNAGRLVAKDEIIQAVWQGTAISDNSLTRAVATLRRLLGDDPREPRYIATVQTVGYRFLCDVQVAHESIVAVVPPPSYRGLRSLAVLPFANGTGPAEAEYLSEGISESIINLLSQFPDLRVVPRASAFRYKGLEVNLKRVGRDLNVGAVLTGTVLQRGDRLIVQTELVDVKNEAQIWGSQFNRKFDDIFELQEELARHICDCLRPRLTSEESELLSKRPTENRDAYLLFLKAMYYANKWSPNGIQKGIAYSQQAIEADPLFAQAYAGLAYLYMLMSVFGGVAPLQAIPLAKAATLRALEIDDTLPTAHACMAYILLAFDWDWVGAERESRLAIELAPNIPGGHHVRGLWFLCSGRLDEAIAEARNALALDPLSLPYHQNLAMTFYLVGEYDAAIEQLQKALELDSSFDPGRGLLILSYIFKGSHAQALAEVDKFASLAGEKFRADIRSRVSWGLVCAAVGKHAEARTVLAEVRQCSEKPPHFLYAYYCAAIHALLGENDEAFEWLEKARQGRTFGLFYFALAPEFKTLHADPRFGDLLRRMELP